MWLKGSFFQLARKGFFKFGNCGLRNLRFWEQIGNEGSEKRDICLYKFGDIGEFHCLNQNCILF